MPHCTRERKEKLSALCPPCEESKKEKRGVDEAARGGGGEKRRGQAAL